MLQDLTSLLEHRTAGEYEKEGFWRTAAQEKERRQSLMQQQQQRLEASWTAALAAATEAKDFGVLCDLLEPQTLNPNLSGEEETDKPVEILPPISWRFDMMPYGADCPDTKTFPTPSHEMVRL